MSNLAADPAFVDEPTHEVLYGRDVVLGTRGLRVTRTLPNRDRRMVGAWCFVDQYGPEDTAMRVPPHPHTELQTVSWLLAGEVVHTDSIGSRQVVRPGTLSLMTAGRGIAHAEQAATGWLHGVQLWVALPDGSRHVAPHFEHHATLPSARGVTVFLGELDGLVSPATAYTPIVGAELMVSGRLDLSLRPDFEYAILGLSGTARVDGAAVSQGPLLYLGYGRTALDVTGEPSARLLLLGGEPFDERIVMWWNFVARTHEEIVAYRDAWESDGVVWAGGARLPAPPMPATPLRPRGRSRNL